MHCRRQEAAAKCTAKRGWPGPTPLDWPQLNSVLFFYMVSPTGDQKHPSGRSRERNHFSTRRPIPAASPTKTGPADTEKMQKEEGVQVFIPNPPPTLCLRFRHPKSRSVYSKKPLSFFVGLAQNTGSRQEGTALIYRRQPRGIIIAGTAEPAGNTVPFKYKVT